MKEKYMLSKRAFIAVILLASVGVGMICTTLITVLCGGTDQTVIRYAVWIVASALYGLCSCLIFAKDRFSLPVGILLHCIACLFITYAACRACRFTAEPMLWAEILVIFVVVYGIIFLVSFLTAKAEAEKINERISGKN